MKFSLLPLLRCSAFVLISCFFSVSASNAHATTHKKHAATSSAGKTSAKSKTAPATKGKSTTKKSTSTARAKSRCTTTRVKTSKGYRSVRHCTRVEDTSKPLTGGAVDSNSANELKARTIPDRAYAVDGYTFFHQGRKYRVMGIDESRVPASGDLAKQRLQLALDSGAISVEPDSVDDNGTTNAVVKVGGKNLADVLNASN